MSQAGRSQNAQAVSLANQIREDGLSVGNEPAQGNGEAWFKLARVYQDRARYGDAERAYRKAVDLLKAGDRMTLVNAMDCMGTMYVETGRYSEAEPLEREALAIREEQKDSVGIGRSRMHLAMLSLGKHQLVEAASEAELAVSILVPERTGLEARNGAAPEEKMTALIDLSLVRCAQGACAEALSHLQRARELARADYRAEKPPRRVYQFPPGLCVLETRGQ